MPVVADSLWEAGEESGLSQLPQGHFPSRWDESCEAFAEGSVTNGYPHFVDRVDAGRQLAAQLESFRGAGTLVLGIPRGGVVVAAEVARKLEAELDVIVARKLGAPVQPELAIGAVTADGERWLNQPLVQSLGITPAYLEEVTRRERAEAERRERLFREGRAPLPVSGRTVIVVDDGLATGATARAALRSVRRRKPDVLILAIPVGAIDSCHALASEADQLVCAFELEDLFAISIYYDDFRQVQDSEVQTLMAGQQPTLAVPPS
jgi:predicted phosphoribosyltransferase